MIILWSQGWLGVETYCCCTAPWETTILHITSPRKEQNSKYGFYWTHITHATVKLKNPKLIHNNTGTVGTWLNDETDKSAMKSLCVGITSFVGVCVVSWNFIPCVDYIRVTTTTIRIRTIPLTKSSFMLPLTTYILPVTLTLAKHWSSLCHSNFAMNAT